MSLSRHNYGDVNGNQDTLSRTITKTDGTVLVRIGSKEERQSNSIPHITETSSTIERRTVPSDEDLEDTRRRQLAKNAAYRQSSTRQYIEGDNNNNISNPDTGHMIYTTVSSKQKQERPRSPNSTTQSFITRKITKGRISTKPNAVDQTIINKSEPYDNHVNGHAKANEDHLEWIARKKLNYQEDGSVKDLPKDACFWCKKTVYQKEKIGPIRDVLYHKQCFRCSVCGFVLNLQNFHQNSNDLEDKSLYCKSHEPETESSRISIKDQRIQAVLNKPKVEQLNPNIRGGPDASKVRSIGTESVSIKGAINAPKLDRFNQTVRINQEHLNDQYIVDDTTYAVDDTTYVVDDTTYVRAASTNSSESIGSYGHGTVSIQVQNGHGPVQNGNATDYYALGMRTAVNVPKVSVYNSTVRPVPEMVKIAPEVHVRPTEYRTRQIMDPYFTRTPTPPSSPQSPQQVHFSGNTKTYYYINSK